MYIRRLVLARKLNETIEYVEEYFPLSPLELKMANVKLTWLLPITRVDGSPASAADVKYAHIDISADGTNWSVFGAYAPDVLEETITDLEPGQWHFRGTVEDLNGVRSAPTTTSVVIPSNAALSPLILTAEIL